MALQVWLPLNGKLNNQGLSNVTVARGDAIVDNSGKIGKCYACNASSYLGFNYTVGETDSFSLSFWLKLPQSIKDPGAWQTLITFRVTDNGTPTSIAIQWTDYNRIKIYGSTNFQTIWLESEYDVWNHYVITNSYSSPNTRIAIYKNGQLVGAYDKEAELKIISGQLYLGAVQDAVGYVYFNDFRIYDHCLSPMEVKEISKALILHYKLDDLYVETTTNIASTGMSGWDNSGTCVRNFNETSIPNPPTTGSVYSVSATSDGSMAMTVGTTSQSYPSTTIVASIYCWLDAAQDTGVVYVRSTKADSNVGNLKYNGEQNPTKWPLRKWIKLVSDPINTASDATTFYICTYINKNTELRVFNGWQIEQNTHATPWTAPGTTRTKTSKAYDCSGYGNDGTIIGSLTTINDTPRYDASTYIVGNANRISAPMATIPDFSYSFWFKRNRVSHSVREMLMTGWYGVSFELNPNNTLTFKCACTSSHSERNVSSTFTFTSTTEWYHVVFTHTDGVNSKIYVNGALNSTASITDLINYSTGVANIGYYSSEMYFNGYMSDFRRYSTVLSDNDVKELYDTSAYIYNNGTVAAYEFIEDAITPQIKKNGQFVCDSFGNYNFAIENTSGATWALLLDHNNPSENLFTQDNCWNNNAENLFSALGMLKHGNWANPDGEYEFLVIEKTTSASTEQMVRWKQTSNPALSSTLSGYQLISGSVSRSVGLMNKNTYGCFHNGASWWCCCGSYSAYNGGIPGFFDTVTTGRLRFYIRIPDVKLLPENKVMFFNDNIQNNNLIEI